MTSSGTKKRRAAKRLRYACEALSPVFGDGAAGLGDAAKELQEVLVEHQDGVVSQQLLRDLADRAVLHGEEALTLGRLHLLEQQHAARSLGHSEIAWPTPETSDYVAGLPPQLSFGVRGYARRIRSDESFHRTLADGWAYDSTDQRNSALPSWLHFYNHHRADSAIGDRPPVTRRTNVPGHHT